MVRCHATIIAFRLEGGPRAGIRKLLPADAVGRDHDFFAVQFGSAMLPQAGRFPRTFAERRVLDHVFVRVVLIFLVAVGAFDFADEITKQGGEAARSQRRLNRPLGLGTGAADCGMRTEGDQAALDAR